MGGDGLLLSLALNAAPDCVCVSRWLYQVIRQTYFLSFQTIACAHIVLTLAPLTVISRTARRIAANHGVYD